MRSTPAATQTVAAGAFMHALSMGTSIDTPKSDRLPQRENRKRPSERTFLEPRAGLHSNFPDREIGPHHAAQGDVARRDHRPMVAMGGVDRIQHLNTVNRPPAVRSPPGASRVGASTAQPG